MGPGFKMCQIRTSPFLQDEGKPEEYRKYRGTKGTLGFEGMKQQKFVGLVVPFHHLHALGWTLLPVRSFLIFHFSKAGKLVCNKPLARLLLSP